MRGQGLKWVVLISVMLLVLGGIEGGSGAPSISIGVVLPTTRISWFKTVQAGMEAAARDLGATLVVTDSENNGARETSNLEDLAIRGVNAIVISAVDAVSSVPAVDAEAKRGITVVAFNMPLKSTLQKTFVGIENEQLGELAGKAAAEYVDKTLHGVAYVAILTHTGSPAAEQRVAGFKKALAPFSGVHYVAEQQGLAPDDSLATTESILQANPNVNVIYAFNEGSTLGSLRAVIEGHKDVAIFGTDMDQVLAGYLRQPSPLKVVATQNPYKIGYVSIQTAINILKHNQVPQRILVPVDLVTPKNVDQFMRTAHLAG